MASTRSTSSSHLHSCHCCCFSCADHGSRIDCQPPRTLFPNGPHAQISRETVAAVANAQSTSNIAAASSFVFNLVSCTTGETECCPCKERTEEAPHCELIKNLEICVARSLSVLEPHIPLTETILASGLDSTLDADGRTFDAFAQCQSTQSMFSKCFNLHCALGAYFACHNDLLRYRYVCYNRFATPRTAVSATRPRR